MIALHRAAGGEREQEKQDPHGLVPRVKEGLVHLPRKAAGGLEPLAASFPQCGKLFSTVWKTAECRAPANRRGANARSIAPRSCTASEGVGTTAAAKC